MTNLNACLGFLKISYKCYYNRNQELPLNTCIKLGYIGIITDSRQQTNTKHNKY